MSFLHEFYDERGEHKFGEVSEEPECGEAFCDHCGDCLHCYPHDVCYDEHDARWISYVTEEEWRVEQE